MTSSYVNYYYIEDHWKTIFGQYCRVFAEKPKITEGPKDVLVQENADVLFNCRASGEPEPMIIWKKVDDQMPQGRWVITNYYIYTSIALQHST